MNKKNIPTILSIIITLTLLFSACSPAQPVTNSEGNDQAPSSESTESQAKQTLVMAVEGSIVSFDPLGASDSRVDTAAINLYNTLMQAVPGSNDMEFELADSFDVSDDNLVYTFTLKQGVLFHDGSEVTADDVAYTIERMLAIKFGYYSTLTPIIGSTVIDDSTVTIDLDAPFPGLTSALARLYIVNADLVKANEENGDYGEKWLQDHDAGSGPYMLASFEPEQQFTLEKFNDYFKGWEGSHAEEVIFRVIKEELTRRLALEEDDIDWATVLSSDAFESLKSVEGIDTYEDVTMNQLYFAFNTQNEYLKDKLIRKALSLAYDYEGHVEMARSGHADIARGALPPSIPCFDESIEPSKMDIEAAKDLMAEAGYPDGGFTLDMAYQGTMAEEVSAFQIMQAGAAELGITINPVAVEWPAKVEAFSSLDTSPAIGTEWMYPGYPDASEFLYQLGASSRSGTGGYNFAWFSNERFDELVNQAQSELDEEQRCELYREAQNIWNDEVPYANIVVGHALAASRDYVKGYVWTPSHAFAQNVYIMSVDAKYE